MYRSLAEERGRMWWGAFGKRRFDETSQSDQELTERALRIARFDKLIVAVFNVLASAIPFLSLVLGSSTFGLTSAISLSLAVTFGFTVLYTVQTLSSFISAESSALLSTLPLLRRDFSLITLFSFVRSVDYMVAGSIASQVVLVAYVTGSPLATSLMLGASIMNAVLAVAIALWFSRLFYKNLLRGGRSKSNTVLRLVFILMWGTLLVGVGFLFSLPSYIVPNLESTLLRLDQIQNFLICILYPFSAGITIGNVVQFTAAFSTILTTSIAMVGYIILAGVAAKWTLETVKRTSQGTGVKVERTLTKDFSLKTHSPLFGYAIKDLKISSRNPATAFFFALPVLETVIMTLMITNFELLRASTILVTTTTGAIFTLFMPLALLSAEGQGLEYAKTLPVNAGRIIASKTLIATATYTPVPLTLLCMTLFKHLTSPLTILIPIITGPAITAACIIEIKLFLKSAAKGRIAALISDLEKLVAGLAITLVPMLTYSALYIVSLSHVLAILGTTGAALAELTTAVYLLKRS